MAKKGKRPKAEAGALPVTDPSKETAEEKTERLERENAPLRKANAQLEMDRTILEGAAVFFAKESE